jgi:uncharacterized membrane protein
VNQGAAQEGLLTAHHTRRRKKTMWSLIVIQWLHVLLGIFWFGSALCVDFVVLPALMTLPLEQQRTVSKPLTVFSDRVVLPAAILVILLGLIRGIVFGPVRSLGFVFGTAYGITFLIAGLSAVTTLLWGLFVTRRAARRLDTFPLTEVTKSGGTVALAFAAQMQRVKLLALLELLGFFILFTCMILMRFGL